MTHASILVEFARLGLTEGDGMMLLADSNVISDNCIRCTEIAEADIENAVNWLRTYRTPNKKHET